jgi:hypothetical protein
MSLKQKKETTMKTTTIALALMLSMMGMTSFAEETMGEKAAATGHDAKRATKKGMHRAQEVVCMEGDAKCLAKKAGHRVEEAKDYTKDKAAEAKNAVDSDEAKK